jgi:hypothetical protein
MSEQYFPQEVGATAPAGERQETGGPNRTPRSEIGPAVSANRKKEPVLLLDLSTSMDWSASDDAGPDWPDQGSRRAVVIGALSGLVRALEDEDTEAAAEQASGSDELGGLMTHGFANGHVEIGDLNSSNLERRLNSIQWGGRTYILPAWKAALADYDRSSATGTRTSSQSWKWSSSPTARPTTGWNSRPSWRRRPPSASSW